jgi:drug/metabolite transporter (DMT)-like permease
VNQPSTLLSPLSLPNERATLMMIAGGLLLGTIGVFVKEAGQAASLTVFFRCLFGCLALGAWALITGKHRELALSLRNLVMVSITGALMVVTWWLYFESLKSISVGLATLIFHVQPFWVVLLGAFFFKERIAPRTLITLVLALFGLMLATGLSRQSLSDMDGMMIGVAYCLMGSVLYALTTLFARSNSGVSPFALAWWQCAIGTLLTLWSPIMLGFPEWGAAWGWLVGIGVIHNGLAFTLLYTAISQLPTHRIAILQFVYPGAAIIIDWWVYDHTLSTVQWAGVVCIGFALWRLRKG